MLKELFSKLPRRADDARFEIKVCMLGARGVGKTSVITSMYNSQKEAVLGTGLFLKADDDTSAMLNDKRQQLEKLFHGVHMEDERLISSGISGDSQETKFCFSYGMNSEKINIDMIIRDYPGEYLKSDPDMVSDFVREASAVLIAIDTPFLMEEDGKYHLAKNRLDLVADFLMNHLSSDEEKLILFVPLKCEKYYKENRIDEVLEKIKKEYGGLISYLRDKENLHGFKNKICCAVTPIQTLGDVVFDSFETDQNGNIVEISTPEGMRVPAHVFYRYARTNAAYRPENCVQPLYYLLSFISKQYEKAKQEQRQSGLLGRFMAALRLVPNVDKFIMEIDHLGRRRLDGTKGYKILFGRGRI